MLELADNVLVDNVLAGASPWVPWLIIFASVLRNREGHG